VVESKHEESAASISDRLSVFIGSLPCCAPDFSSDQTRSLPETSLIYFNVGDARYGSRATIGRIPLRNNVIL
jgi:hypothetical protein